MPPEAGRLRRLRLVAVLRPVSVRVRWWESLLVVLIGSAVAFFRIGPAALRGALWAEDARTFLSEAYTHSLWEVLFEPYRGYALTLPRLVAQGVSALPLQTQGVALLVAAAVVQAALSLTAYHVVAAHTPPRGDTVAAHALARIAPILVALAVVAVPVGPETVLNLANLQWFVLYAGCLTAFWSPRGWPGTLAVAVLLLLVTTTSPFGAAAVLLAGIAWLLARTWSSFIVLAAGAAGTVAQLLAMASSPETDGRIHTEIRPRFLTEGYLNRVLSDGLFGLHHHPGFPYGVSGDSSGLVLAAAVLLLGTAIALWWAARLSALVVPILLLLLSAGSYAALMVVSGSISVGPFESARYYVPPALFLLTAAAILVGRCVRASPEAADPASDPEETTPLPTTERRPAARLLAAVLGIALGGTMLYGLITSWDTQGVSFGRATAPGWNEQLPAARAFCRTEGSSGVALITATPASWKVSVPCHLLLSR